MRFDMNLYKRPEKELDPVKKPGQIINRPSHFEMPLVKAVEEYKKCSSRFTPNGPCFKSECDCHERR
jgi:hypothetical protein